MLIITGSLAYDYIMDFYGNFSDYILPDQKHQINLSFIVNEFAKRRGGTAGNVSYTLALLKVPHILFSIAGKDFNEYKKDFKKKGIDCQNVAISKDTYTATGFAMTDKNDNQIWGFYNGAIDQVYKLKLSKVATGKDQVLIGPQGARGAMSLLRQCVDMGCEYMFDPGFILTQITDEELKFGLINARYIVGNDYEIHLIKKRIYDFEKITNRSIIITTFGAEGASIEEDGKKIPVKAAKAKKVVDPSGAGDAWRAGFLAGRHLNLSLKSSGQIAALCSTYAIENYGTQEHSFNLKTFTKRYMDVYNESLSF